MTSSIQPAHTAREQLDRLDALREAGTPASWTEDVDGKWIWHDDSQELVASALVPADAALIVAAVNALPQHVAAIRAVLELADALEQEAKPLIAAMKGEPLDGLARKYLTGRVTASQDAIERIRTAITEALQ